MVSETDQPNTTSSSEDTKEPAPVGFTPVRALVVDDVPANCRVMKALLARYGTADTVLHAREAVAAFQTAWKCEQPYNLICLDIMLPEIDGVKLLEVLRKMEAAMNLDEGQRAKVIMVSALDDNKFMGRCRELGACAFLVKPIDSSGLANCLRKTGLVF